MPRYEVKPIPLLTAEQIADFWSKVDKTPGHGPHGDCWLWTGGCTDRGYGAFTPMSLYISTHRLAYFLATGKNAEHCVLHSCDTPTCVRPEHLCDGTHKENARQREERGRSQTGDQHWSRLFPERVPRGDDNWTRRRPELVARGERNGSWTKPERRPRGERNGMAKLTAVAVLEIRRRFNAGECNRTALGREFGVSNVTITNIVTNRVWTSV